jgi:uncharacterized protein YbjT (DUF2867 family)
MILLTGATGRIGGAAAKALAKANIPFRVFVRDAEKFTLNDNANIDIVVGDMQNVDDIRRAVDGVEKALLVCANGEQQASMEMSFAREAAAAGVSHVIKISSMEAAPDAVATFPKQHFEIEMFIKTLNINWTMVRPNFFMQNLLLFAAGIKNANLFALPLGAAKTGMLDAADVGEYCAALLQQAGHEGQTYEVTGLELFDFHEVAARMSAVVGKEIRYIDQDPEEFRNFLGQFIQSQWHLDGVCGLFAEIADHSLEKVTTTMADTLGRDPVSLEDFTATYINAFK